MLIIVGGIDLHYVSHDPGEISGDQTDPLRACCEAKRQAQIAVHAEKMMRRCGYWAMARYACKRGVSLQVLLLAIQLEHE